MPPQPERNPDAFRVDHAEATELAGLYVLDALEPPLRSAVDAHLGACTDGHLEPMEAPGALRSRIMAAVQERR